MQYFLFHLPMSLTRAISSSLRVLRRARVFYAPAVFLLDADTPQGDVTATLVPGLDLFNHSNDPTVRYGTAPPAPLMGDLHLGVLDV